MEKLECIKEIQQYLRLNSDNGVTCPCCYQYVKIYKRKLSSHMVVSLISLFKKTMVDYKDWYHINEFIPKGQRGAGDYSFMRFWGLIEKKDDVVDDSKKSNGLWRITRKGIGFCRNLTTVPSHAKIYNGKLIELCGENKYLIECLGSKFSYSELMSA